MMRFVPSAQVKITDPAWVSRAEMVRSVVLPYQWDMLNDRVAGVAPSRCVRNFRAAAGDVDAPHEGTVFLDTDLYKWLEAAAYILAHHRDDFLLQAAQEATGLILRAQGSDGYLSTYYTLVKPDRRYTNLMEGHELYCAGHMIEAAVACAQSGLGDALLQGALKLARHLYGVFIGDNRFPGHPEVELALIRLFEQTGERFCLDLALHFIAVRGGPDNPLAQERQDPAHEWVWEDMRRFGDSYFQAHLPAREQRTAEGHAVRAVYLYAAMADAARLTHDAGLKAACLSLFQNIENRRMYVTGGIGSSAFGERFTCDWDLPLDTMYCETCASVGLMQFARRMTALTGDAAFMGAWERALRNTVLAGMGRDGKHFFYVNPLSVNPQALRHNAACAHVRGVRPAWFGVACCPPNAARAVASLSGSLYAREEGVLWLMAQVDSEMSEGGLSARLTHRGSEYALEVDGPALDLRIRIPDGHDFQAHGGERHGGVWTARHPGGRAAHSYTLAPRARLVFGSPKADSMAGRACVMRGTDVYCLEEKDNGAFLSAVYVPQDAAMTEIPSPLGGELPALRVDGLRRAEAGAAYSDETPVYAPERLTFVPYRDWGNRGEGEMRVFVNVLPGTTQGALTRKGA